MEDRQRKRPTQYRQNQHRVQPQGPSAIDLHQLQSLPRLQQYPSNAAQEAIMSSSLASNVMLNLNDGVLRGADGQMLQLIAVNSDGNAEYHNTLSGGEIITGQLVNGMLVNFTTSLHPQEVLIDSQGQQHYANVADAAIMQYDGSNAQLVVSHKHPSTKVMARSKKRVGSSGALNLLPPLTPFASVQPPLATDQMHVSATSSTCAQPPPKQRLASSPPSLVAVEQPTRNVCELCSIPFSSQLDFFRHLQTHYEPSDPIAANVKVEKPLKSRPRPVDLLPPLAMTMEGSNPSATSTTGEYDNMESSSSADQEMDDAKHCIDNYETMVVNIQRQDHNDELYAIEPEDDDVKHEDEDEGDRLEDDATEWFEEDEGDIDEEVIFDEADEMQDEAVVDRVEDDIQQQIDEEHDIDAVVTVDGNCSTVRIENSTAANSTIATGKRRNASNKTITMASKMDCFDEILGPPSKKNAIKTRSTRLRRGKKRDASRAGDAVTTAANSPTKTYRCRLCEKVCKTKNSLYYHFLLHTGERPHQCDECGKGFFANSALKVHMRLHTGDKPYTCEVCSRAFRQWGDLRYHMTSLHSDEKNHQCEFCGKDFARRYSLVIHRRIHTGEKKYKCEFCDKTFRASNYLQDHRRIHTGEKPHECETCGKKFRVRGDLKRHWNIHLRSKRGGALEEVKHEVDDVDNVADDDVAVLLEYELETQEVEEAVHNMDNAAVAIADEIVDVIPKMTSNKKKETVFKGAAGSSKMIRRSNKNR